MSKDLTALKSKDLLTYYRDLIRKTFGDKVENESDVFAYSGGNYRISFQVGDQSYAFGFKKKSANKVARAIRALK
jgi:hypothetical protein